MCFSFEPANASPHDRSVSAVIPMYPSENIFTFFAKDNARQGILAAIYTFLSCFSISNIYPSHHFFLNLYINLPWNDVLLIIFYIVLWNMTVVDNSFLC